MKKNTLLLLYWLFVLVANAQTNWSPTGAEWNYSWVSFGTEGYVNYKYAADTTVLGRPCHKINAIDYTAQHIDGGHFTYDTSDVYNLFTASAGDTVWFYYSLFNKWAPAYYFNAQVGDTLVMANYSLHTNSDSTVAVLVDSTGTMQVDNHNLRYYCFHVIDSVNWCLFTGKAVERLGMTDNDIIPFWHCITDDYYYTLCNYKDDSTAVYPSNANCQLVNGISELSNQHSTFSIYPNPASTSVIITADESLIGSTATITDITGRKVATVQLNTQHSTFSTESFATGVYFVNIGNVTRKLIIHR